MNNMDKAATKLENNEPLNVLHYVRLKHDSKERRKKILADNGTYLSKKFLKEHPNVKLMERPFIDCEYSTRNMMDRNEYVNMCGRLQVGDIDMVILDDIDELASSFADCISANDYLKEFGIVVYDISTEKMYSNLENQMLEHTIYMMIRSKNYKFS